MEILEGGTLHQKIESNGCLNEIDSLKYLRQLLEGIEFLHKNELYHSDIKLANNFLQGMTISNFVILKFQFIFILCHLQRSELKVFTFLI